MFHVTLLGDEGEHIFEDDFLMLPRLISPWTSLVLRLGFCPVLTSNINELVLIGNPETWTLDTITFFGEPENKF